MAKKITDDDLDLLEELGIEAEPTTSGGRTAREQRIIAGFEEIERFYVEHGRVPGHGQEMGIFERLYAVRLDQIRSNPECRSVLLERDPHGLLGIEPESSSESLLKEEPTDEEILNALGLDPGKSEDVSQLVHVRSRDEIKAAEEIAQRNPCADFDLFKPVFESVQADLGSGRRQSIKYKDNAEVKCGDLFILDGQKVLVATMGEPFVSDYGRPDRRLRVVYDNGTESDLLVRSLQRALNKDKTSRRITEPDLGPLFSDQADTEDLPTGHIYVLRSKSDHPFIAEVRQVLHKIGVTGGDIKKRLAGAAKDPTYLLAEVELVATFKLSNINRNKLEGLLHKVFAATRLDMQLKDRFGGQVEPKEWFLVPLPAIHEAVDMLINGTIESHRYDPESAQFVPCE